MIRCPAKELANQTLLGLFQHHHPLVVLRLMREITPYPSASTPILSPFSSRHPSAIIVDLEWSWDELLHAGKFKEAEAHTPAS